MVMKKIRRRRSSGSGVAREPRIVIAGCGPGAVELMTPAACAAAGAADVLVGAKRLLDLFPSARVRRIPVGADVKAVIKQMAAIPPSKRVTVLVSGDPGLYSLARAVLARFGRGACRVIAAVSSVQAAFARVGVTWEDARIVSAHEAAPAWKPRTLVREDKIAVLAGNRAAASWLKAAVMALHKSHVIWVCSDLTLPEECVDRVTLRRFDPASLPSRTVILFVRRTLLR